MAPLSTRLKTILLGSLTLASILAAASAHAESAWERAHPRRDQVLDRTQHLNRRIARERRKRELTPGQAHALHREVRQTRLEQAAMARANGGFITKSQQSGLNQQENAIRRSVGP